MKRESSSRAFETLAGIVGRTKPIDNEANRTVLSGGMDYDTFQRLMSTVYSFSTGFIKTATNQSKIVEVYWSLLQTDGVIKETEFGQLPELLNMKIAFVNRTAAVTLFESCFPNIFNSTPSMLFRSMVKSKYFRLFFDGLILLNAILIAVHLEDRLDLEWILLISFTFEIIAKLYAFGFIKFIQKFWNVFDLLVIGSALGFFIVIKSQAFPEQKLEEYLDLLLILRILRLCKVIGTIPRFKIVVKTIQNLQPAIMTYGGLLFVVFYVYATIGKQIFGGLIHPKVGGCSSNTIDCCPDDLLYKSIRYCTINFNTFANSLLFLFDLMVVNQWHILARGPEIVTGTKWTRLYFVSFHLICVIVVLNIFTAFVLEAFIMEYANVQDRNKNKNKLLGEADPIGDQQKN